MDTFKSPNFAVPSLNKNTFALFKSFTGEQENEDKALLQTIRIPKNLLFLSDKLPKPNYSKHMRSSNSVVDKLNVKNYRSFSKKSDFENIKQNKEVNENRKENIIKKINIIPYNNINNNNNSININPNINNKALPVLNIAEPKISNKSLELDNHKNSNNNNSNNSFEIKKNLVHSSSQKLIINDSNKKILNKINSNIHVIPGKIMNRNISSELPSLNIINQKNRNINHLNDIYNIYAPYLNKPQIKNNLKYKAYNNNYYLRNIQRYYKIEKPNIINGNNNEKKYNAAYQIRINRLVSGRKILPNRKLSPLKRNIINIC